MSKHVIKVRGAQQNNLKGLDLDIPHGSITVVTGPSGSGKSSLAFDTVYAEGQRRNVETFSPYARQFLDRQDRPRVKRIEGIPPAIAIDQVNPVRTSRSTVGTMSELADHLKLLFARATDLYCMNCGRLVRRDSPEAIANDLLEDETLADTRVSVTFTIKVPRNFTAAEVTGFLEQQGYTRIHSRHGKTMEVIQDRVRLKPANRARLTEALEAAFLRGHGHLAVRPLTPHPDPLPDGERVQQVSPFPSKGELHPAPSTSKGEGWGEGENEPPSRASSLPPEENPSPTPPSSPREQGGENSVRRYSTELHCAHCNITYAEPIPALFSFNSPAGACETCRGFGRTQGIDYGLVIPDESLSLAEGAVKPFQTKSFKACQRDLMRYAKKRRIP